MSSTGKQIVLGVTGSIAAYKAVELLRLLHSAGHEVRVIQTAASLNFVGEATFRVLSGHPVARDPFSGEAPLFPHIKLAGCGLMVIAPATANTIGKMAAGIADNLLLDAYLAMAAPVAVCPAMNVRMWNHPAVKRNLKTLAGRGVAVIPPGEGKLACGEEGEGRMAEPSVIMESLADLMGERGPRDFAGRRVLVTAGATREPIDSVRYITNRSSGKMGFALADAARRRGAEVTVIAANTLLSREAGIRYVDVTTSAEMAGALSREYEPCDILLMAAAVADYKVSSRLTRGKIERRTINDLQLKPTGDIVSSLKVNDDSRLTVGFAAEYGSGKLERARAKMRDKRLDMIVFNDISRSDVGFESDLNEIVIMSPGRPDVFVGKTGKADCANRILDQVKELIIERQGAQMNQNAKAPSVSGD